MNQPQAAVLTCALLSFFVAGDARSIPEHPQRDTEDREPDRLNRVLTWTTTGLTAGHHVFKVVNPATAGHPRIDVNAALSD
jgi:hypothetical protein